MTTANPYHKINPAIRSRCQIFKLNPLNEEDILKGLKKACKYEDIKDIIDIRYNRKATFHRD